ncbi:YjzD family protein [Sutcliffiella halmapala]|uniref:YjzD family protein n=1 Tax=Sutcliffiella halmapala TaxID=79882 RepID=UPI000994EB8D|nr:YjzD family protein [Sutcliffiella halmapala]
MRAFWTIFWSLLLINMVSYVVANMQGDTYNYILSSAVAVVFAVLVMLVGEALPNEPVEKH